MGQRMGFDWGPPDDRAYGPGAWDTYTGRPLPPWPPANVSGASFSCCLACPRRRPRCADCPADEWERPGYASSTSTPERREPFLTRLFRKVKK